MVDFHAKEERAELTGGYSSKRISKYTAALAYNITENGDASISLEYDHGTDKDTLAWLNQYVVKLNYKY
jgi:hypothetical protein